MIVKANDRYPVTFVVNMNLTGTTVRLLARVTGQPAPPFELPHEVTDPAGGVIEYVLDGTLTLAANGGPGRYDIEAEVTSGAEIMTFPTGQGNAAQFLRMSVVPDLDS